MRQLLRIIVAIFIILATVTCADVIFGRIIDRLYVDSDCTKFGYAINSSENPELIFVGSSRAQHHYDTPFINDSLHITALNLGEAGRGLTYSYAIIASYLHRHHPKVVILELLPDDLSGELNDRIKPLFPFVDSEKSISETANIADSKNFLLLNSHFLRYNSEIINIVKAIRHPYSNKNYGFIPLKDKKHTQHIERTHRVINEKIDSVALKSLFNIVKICKQNNVKLAVAFSPEYFMPYPPPCIFHIINQLDIHLIDYRHYSPDKTDEAFYDNYHLTGYGAREYTRYFIESNRDLFE